jgi:hypothetical protein
MIILGLVFHLLLSQILISHLAIFNTLNIFYNQKVTCYTTKCLKKSTLICVSFLEHN